MTEIGVAAFLVVPGEVCIGGERYDLCRVPGWRTWSDRHVEVSA